MISIVDYGLGNIRSVENALSYLKHAHRVIRKPEQIAESKKLILPGVGSFRVAMENINRLGLLAALHEAVLERKTPVLGICLGMQLLADEGDEDGPAKGLGWVPGTVKRFPAEGLGVKIPHMGFDTVIFNASRRDLFKGLRASADFYFVHSYRMLCKEAADVSGVAVHGEKFTASVQRGHIFGTQFHPEKSQSSGLQVLKNFCQWKGSA